MRGTMQLSDPGWRERVKALWRRAACAAALSVMAALCFFADAADRNPGYEIVYPADALIQNGGCVYDITAPPEPHLTAAAAHGATDDLQAFVDAYDYILALMDNGRPFDDEQVVKNPNGQYIVYLPDGVYLVSDMITYTGPTRFDAGRTDRNENVVGMKFVGQSREGTIVRLAPGSTGFDDPESPKPVFAFARPDVRFNNWACKVHGCRNLTVDVSANAGAVGIDYWSANSGLLMNVHIRADAGAGAIGLHLRIAVAAGYFQDITVDGFEYGIRSDGAERASHPVFEHITLRGQRTAAFSVGYASTTVRDLTTSTPATAVELRESSAQLVLLDSELLEGSPHNAAMHIRGSSHLFARSITVGGYGGTVRKDSFDVTMGNIDELTSYDWRCSRDGTQSMNMPIEDVPIVPFSLADSHWVKPTGHDNAAVQAAMDAGEETVYFPENAEYSFGTVRVPATVVRIDGMSHDLKGVLLIEEASPRPLIIMDAKEVTVDNRTSRTVVMLGSGQWGEIRNGGTAQKWHLCSVGQMKVHNVTNADVWGRWINAEGVRYLTINDCRWVQLGYKSERQDMPGVQIRDGSRVELLGGTFGVHNSDTLVFIDSSSEAVVVANNSGPYSATLPAIVDEGYAALYKEDFPQRTSDYWFFMFTASAPQTSPTRFEGTGYTPRAITTSPAETVLRIRQGNAEGATVYDCLGRRLPVHSAVLGVSSSKVLLVECSVPWTRRRRILVVR